MPVDHTPSVAAGRPYARPSLTALGTLADLTRGDGGPINSDTLGDSSGDEGSV